MATRSDIGSLPVPPTLTARNRAMKTAMARTPLRAPGARSPGPGARSLSSGSGQFVPPIYTKPARLTAERILEHEPTGRQLQRTRRIIRAPGLQLRVVAVVQDRRAQGRHVHPQLVLAPGDRLKPVGPGGAIAFQHVDHGFAVRLALDLA